MTAIALRFLLCSLDNALERSQITTGVAITETYGYVLRSSKKSRFISVQRIYSSNA